MQRLPKHQKNDKKPQKSAEQYQRDHELGLLKILIDKHGKTATLLKVCISINPLKAKEILAEVTEGIG